MGQLKLQSGQRRRCSAWGCLAMLLHAGRQRIPRCFQVSVSKYLIGLKICSLGPFVPAVDEYNALVAEIVFAGLLNRGLQTTPGKRPGKRRRRSSRGSSCVPYYPKQALPC